MQAIKGLIFTVLFVATGVARAEVFYYGESFLSVDLRADEASLLKFPKAPLSSSCQPTGLTFEPIDQRTLTLGERQMVQERAAASAEKEPAASPLAQLIRVSPQPEKLGTTFTCSFTLQDGAEVPVKFLLSDKIVRPFLDFHPIGEKFAGVPQRSEMKILQSLVKGEPLGLEEVTGGYTSCREDYKYGTPTTCTMRFRTPLADYDLSYVGSDSVHMAWKFSLSLNHAASYAEAADLKVTQAGNILYSAVLPQKERFDTGETVTLYIVTTAQIAVREIQEVLP